MTIKTVTIIGANGNMGINISGIFASFGNAKVYMVARSIEDAEKAAQLAYRSVRADSILKKCHPADYSMLERCIKESELVFESTKESMDVKKQVTKLVSEHLDDHTIFVSGTSGLSLTELSGQLKQSQRKNYMGMHFFNPPYNLTLCELTPTPYTDRKIFEDVRQYVTKVLYRTPVEVKDSPAFLGNRIGFQFINEALQYAELYQDNGGIDFIDAILGSFTGRNMPPLRTADFVGLDVHKAIVDNLYQNTHDYAQSTFLVPEFIEKLLKNKLYGKKSKSGLYKSLMSDEGTHNLQVYDISTGKYRNMICYNFPFVETMVSAFCEGDYQTGFRCLIHNKSLEARLCLEFLLKYILYSLTATELVGYNIHSADDVMAEGFNWCPPLAMIDALFGADNVKHLMYERLDGSILRNVDIDNLMLHVEPSAYDYRKYIRAKR